MSDHILTTPTLIKLPPAPVRKIIGDLGRGSKFLLAFGAAATTTLDNVKPGSERYS